MGDGSAAAAYRRTCGEAGDAKRALGLNLGFILVLSLELSRIEQLHRSRNTFKRRVHASNNRGLPSSELTFTETPNKSPELG